MSTTQTPNTGADKPVSGHERIETSNFLMIVLILVQINVAQAMKKIISELPPASIEEVEKLREEAADLALELAAKKLQSGVTESDRDRLVDEFITRVQPTTVGGGAR